MLNEKKEDINNELNKETKKYFCINYLIILDIKKQYGELFDVHIKSDSIYSQCYDCCGYNNKCDNFITKIWFDNLIKKGYDPYQILERKNKKKNIKKPNFLERLICEIIKKW